MEKIHVGEYFEAALDIHYNAPLVQIRYASKQNVVFVNKEGKEFTYPRDMFEREYKPYPKLAGIIELGFWNRNLL